MGRELATDLVLAFDEARVGLGGTILLHPTLLSFAAASEIALAAAGAVLNRPREISSRSNASKPARPRGRVNPHSSPPSNTVKITGEGMTPTSATERGSPRRRRRRCSPSLASAGCPTPRPQGHVGEPKCGGSTAFFSPAGH